MHIYICSILRQCLLARFMCRHFCSACTLVKTKRHLLWCNAIFWLPGCRILILKGFFSHGTRIIADGHNRPNAPCLFKSGWSHTESHICHLPFLFHFFFFISPSSFENEITCGHFNYWFLSRGFPFYISQLRILLHVLGCRDIFHQGMNKTTKW